MAINNIIYDLGGVLLNIDYKKTEAAFNKLGYKNFEKMYSQFTADELFVKLETGTISPDDFIQLLTNNHHPPVSPRNIITAWNAMLLDWRLKSLSFLQEIAKDRNIFLLSNTNKIHEEAFNISLHTQTGMASIDHLFSRVWYSHKIGYRKPNADTFEFILHDAGLKVEETLFIDDSANNIAIANALGFKTHLLLKGEAIESLNYTI